MVGQDAASRQPGDGRLSVVIITRGRPDELAERVRELTSVPGAPPVIVVDNGDPADGGAPVVCDHPHVEVLAPGRNLGAFGRTLGALAADTPYVAFCDDDGAWCPGALELAVAALDRHPNVAAVVGRMVVGPAATLDPLSAEMAASPLPPRNGTGPGPGVIGLSAGATVVRRSAFLHVGGFHRRYGVGGEEALLALDLRADGWDVNYLDAAVVHHRPSEHGRDDAARRRRMARNDLWTIGLRHPLRGVPGAVAARLRDEPWRTALGAAVDAIAGLGWVVRERRPLPPEIMAELAEVARATPG